ncbi:hypothetical protein [Sphingobium yanoikuyae]|uniref:hypothetical protein n=1 Tax=Sphingobium yanoikuyae TaxID=13690 RepID=UPI0028DD0C80|nr:hypothetical protein [Sphingobium yanoikuyae]
MINLEIALHDLKKEIEKSENGVVFGSSFVKFFESNLLNFSLQHCNDDFLIWIGESADPFSHMPDLESRISLYSQYIYVEGIAVYVSTKRGKLSVIVSRTYRGTCPIYASYHGENLFVSWRYEDVVHGLSDAKPNIEACKIFIQHGATQIRDQVIAGTYNLWPAETLRFSESHISFIEAPERAIPSPTPIHEHARVCEAFYGILKDDLQRYAGSSPKPLVEVSGGLDSGTLALAAGAVFPNACSYGLIQLGVLGEQQRRRRSELVDLAKLIDFEFPADAIPPFRGLEQEETWNVVFDDNHRPSCAAATDAHPSGPFDLLIAGIGGDEIMMQNTYTRQDWEVAGTICTSTTVSGIARADMFLRRGIWPVNPFSSIELIDFCRSLPRNFLQGRQLVKMNLARLGLSDGFLFPRFAEHYGEMMRYEMAFLDFDSLFSDSISANYELTAFSGLLKETHDAHYYGFSYELIGKLWNIAKLDRVLSRYIG